MRTGDGSLTFSSFNSLLVLFVFGGLLVTLVVLVTIIESQSPIDLDLELFLV